MTLDRGQLAGSVRDALLHQIRQLPGAWASISAADQRSAIAALEANAVELVQDVIDAVNDAGVTSIECAVHRVSTKKETHEAVISISRDHEDADALVHAAYGPAKISFVNALAQHLETGETPQPMADEPSMFKDEEKALPAPDEKPVRRRRGKPKADLELVGG